ncbi:SDR family NAD(P)-dependent oxidoreductase [Kitasatospora sp. LaBMicrA B282]|uniref:SDR family NAD(P)-dependent oxidoreductase n=1 Tax=Kitasatospora sp. LaBMicrA B282 TaxID=3420949 RepID=UPI003D0C314D
MSTVEIMELSPGGAQETDGRIAVVGMGCRLPGGVVSPAALWEALIRGRDLVEEVPADRWDSGRYYDPEPGVPGRSVSRWGGFVEDLHGFDPGAFGIGAGEAEFMDPAQRLVLEVSWEGLIHAGIAPSSLAGAAAGVFLGMSHNDHEVLLDGVGLVSHPYATTGSAHSIAAGRVAYHLDVHGPAVTVDTACSSGLVSVHLAVRSLLAGECDLALAGGVTVIQRPETGLAFSGLGMLSPTGRCRPFDAGADGFVRSEGCAVVVLKPLAAALRDGDRVWAVIRGTAVNQDGRSDSITTPSRSAQEAVYRRALREAGVEPGTVGLVETHGTGTPVGDPIEFAALRAVYGVGEQPCALGAVKSQTGHTESVSGVVGLIKAVLALDAGVVPGNLHFDRWNREIDPAGSRLFVPQAVGSWPVTAGPRRAAVSAFGFSGTNVHAVLEQAPQAVPAVCAADTAEGDTFSPGAGRARLVVWSGSTAQARDAGAGALADWLEAHRSPPSLSDLAHTLAARRDHLPFRLAATAADIPELVAQLRAASTGQSAVGLSADSVKGRVAAPVWVFSGQGSQWPGMVRDLLDTEPAFADALARVEPLIVAEAGFSVLAELHALEPSERIDRVQPVLFALQTALAATWRAHGVEPAAVIGHSMGEVAAAVVAGALTLADGARVICGRTRHMVGLSGRGAMASVEMPPHQVRQELDAAGITDVTVAVLASPTTTVIAGDTARVHDLVDVWGERGFMARLVRVDVASHSSQLDPILDDLAEAIAQVQPTRALSVPFYSTVLDDPRATPAFDAGYWVDNLRRPVRFTAAVEAAVTDGHRVFIELSPHPLLTRAISETARHAGREVAALATLRRGESDGRGMLDALGAAHCAGAAADRTLWDLPSDPGQLADLPLPRWDRSADPTPKLPTNVGATTRRSTSHPLLGNGVEVPRTDGERLFTASVGTDTVPWLADHRVRGIPAMPAVGYAEIALAAATDSTIAACGPAGAVEITGLYFEDLLLLAEATTLTTTLTPTADGMQVAVLSAQGREWTTHARATILDHPAPRTAPPRQDLGELTKRHTEAVDTSGFYSWTQRHGIHLGPAFQGLVTARTVAAGDAKAPKARTLLAEVRLPAAQRAEADAYRVHPALLDCTLQALALLAAPALSSDRLILPQRIDTLHAYGDLATARYCLAVLRDHDDRSFSGDVRLLTSTGEVVAELEGIQIGRPRSANIALLDEHLVNVEWDRTPRAHTPSGALSTARDVRSQGPWLLLTDTSIDTTSGQPTTTAPHTLAAALREAGITECHVTALTTADGTPPPALVDGTAWSRVVLLPAAHAPQSNGDLLPVTSETITHARDLVQHLTRIAAVLAEHPTHPPRLCVITSGAQAVEDGETPNPLHAGLTGACRVLRNEHPDIALTLIDIDDLHAPGTAAQTAAELAASRTDEEIAVRSGRRYAARLRVAPLKDADLHTVTADPAIDGMSLQVRSPGDLETVTLLTHRRRHPGPGEIEVRVHAFGLNFVDALAAAGVDTYFDDPGASGGCDIAGTVTAVGPGVRHLRPGSRVAAMVPAAHSHAIGRADAAFELPETMSFQEGAGLPSVYLTAWTALHHLAHLQASERVLIHCASGGVGHAAIAVARSIGAEIFTTAGTEAKREYLRTLGIRHVHDSRSLDFADEIRAATDGAGVDVVLNCLTGPALRAGLELLRPGGRFVEIGKYDLYADTLLGMGALKRNISFHALDLQHLFHQDTARFAGLLREVAEPLYTGKLPALPVTTYPLTAAADALRTLGAGAHLGKLVIDMPQQGALTALVPPDQATPVRPDGSYIVTGAFGGLGQLVIRYLAESGAGRVVLNGRTPPDQQTQATLAALQATTGCDIQTVLGDISSPATGHRLVEAATASGLPVRGVLHAAAVIEDAAATRLTPDLTARVWAPKTLGALHLHHAARQQPLDWWCNFSSASALLGMPGQSAYAAASTWLDAFTRHQRAQGTPAISIGWGAWAERGRGTHLADQGYAMIAPDEGIQALDRLLRHTRAHSGYLPIHGSGWLPAFAPHAPRYLSALTPQTTTDGDPQDHTATALLAELAELPAEQRQTRLEGILIHHAATILRIAPTALDPDQSLIERGLDSLGVLELRTRIERQLTVWLSPKTVWANPTPAQLARHIQNHIDNRAPATGEGTQQRPR